MRRFIFAIYLFAFSDALAAADPSPPLVITDVTLIDGTGAAPRAHMTIRIESGHLVAIVPTSSKTLTGDLKIEGTGKFLVPGFFDNNAHLTVYGQPARRDTSAKYGDRNEELALEFAQRTLKAGVTAVFHHLLFDEGCGFIAVRGEMGRSLGPGHGRGVDGHDA